MLKLENIDIKFDHKCIFNDSVFEAYPNELTVIYGKSGIGKSTLLDTLLFKYSSIYTYNDEVISYANRSEFIYKNISYVRQIPILIEELTINNHIDIIQKTYSLDNIYRDLVDRFHIQHLLNKYPNQLSQGEKTRVALYLAILKEPNILILDEPTASLDIENKTVIIQFLKDYAHSGHIVICASHDQVMLDSADTLYQINKSTLIKKYKSHHNDTRKLTSYKKSTLDFFEIHMHMDKFKRTFHVLTYIILSLTIAFTFISLSLNNAYINQLKNNINEFSSRELIVYKNIYSKNKFSSQGIEFPLNSNDLKAIKNIKGVESVEWRFDTILDEISTFPYAVDTSYNYSQINSYLADKKINTLTNEHVFLHTYIDKIDYSKQIDTIYNHEGVYVSSTLFHSLFDNQPNIKNPYIEFYLMIPQYNSTGISYEINPEYEGDSIDESPANHVTCKPVLVRMPIQGVLQGSVLSQENSADLFHIYISQSKMNEYIEKYNPSVQEQTLYWLSKENKYVVNSIPSGYILSENDQVVHQTKWQPNGYSVIVEDLSILNNVIDELHKLDFRVDNQYFDTHSILNVEKSTQNMFIIFSSVLMSIILITYFILSYISKDSYKKTNDFFKNLGYSSKFINQFNNSGRIYHSIKLYIMSVMMYLIIRFILEMGHIAYIQLNAKIFIIMGIVIFIIQYVYPYLLQRGVNHD